MSRTTSKNANVATAGTIGVLSLALMNILAVAILRGLPAEVEYGLSSIFYYLFAAVFFLIPVSLVAAELATGWPEKGGVFRWVGEAFKGRLAFLAVYMLFLQTAVYFPTALTFGAVSLAYVDTDQTIAAKISSNTLFVLIVVLGIYWLATFIALRGVAAFSRVAKWAGYIGVIAPAVILIVMGFAYVLAGNQPQIEIGWDQLLPDFTNFGALVLAASIFLFYAGMEMNAIHVKEVKNAPRNYPLSVLIAAAGTVLIFVLGTLAVAFVVPKADINLTQSLLTSYYDMFTWAHMEWAAPVVAVMLAIGVLGAIVVWAGNARHGPVAAVRHPAVGAVRFPDPQPTRHHLLPRDVHADVRRRHPPAPDPARPPAAVQAAVRQGRCLDHRRCGIPCLAARLPSELLSARPDLGRQPRAVRRHPGRAHGRLRRIGIRHLCAAQAIMARPCERYGAVHLGAARGTRRNTHRRPRNVLTHGAHHPAHREIRPYAPGRLGHRVSA